MKSLLNNITLVPISDGVVTKLILPGKNGEKERALHFLPPNTNIHEHMHNIDAGTSEIYIVWNNDKEKWEAISISKDVAGPWKEDPSHSAEASEKEPSLIFGAKRRIRRTRMDRQYKYI